MKRFLSLVAACCIFSSCSIQKYSQAVYLADYRAYSAEGFTITPSSSGFTYESIGDLSIEFVKGRKDGYTNEKARNPWENIYIPTHEYMVAEIVKEAKSLGANALLNSHIKATPNGYTASGFAVKLK